MNRPPIPQSQKNRVRVNALKAWRAKPGDGLNAKVGAERSNERDIQSALGNDFVKSIEGEPR